MIVKRNFKKVNLMGLDFYVDWVDATGDIICIKEVQSGRIFVYRDLVKDGVPVEDLFRDLCGIPRKEVKKEVKVEVKEEAAPAALETEQPKEQVNEQKAKGRNRKVQK